MANVEDDIRSRLTTFQNQNWPVVQRVALCARGRQPIEIARTGEGTFRTLKPLDVNQEWANALRHVSEGDVLWIPTTSAAIALIPVRLDTTLVLDCATVGKLGVISVLARELASELRSMLVE